MEKFGSPEFRNELAKTIKEAPKEERRNILDNAKEEEILRIKATSGKILRPVKVEQKADGQNLESELTPEQIEKIMEKVRDIYAYGTAYTSITGARGGYDRNKEKMESMLKYGLIGKDMRKNWEDRRIFSPERWREDVRERLNPVHFNIVGRTLAYRYGGKSIGEVIKSFKESEPGKAGEPFPRMRGFNGEYTPPYFVFDISSFKEMDMLFNDRSQKGLSRAYRINAPKEEVDMTPDSHNKIGVGAEYGFQLNHRLPPRLITGIVISYEDKSKIEEIVKTMKTAFPDPEKMIPIYVQNETWGPYITSRSIHSIKTMKEYEDFCKESATFRLVWPKKMSYEEVMKFVAEKENKGDKKE